MNIRRVSIYPVLIILTVLGFSSCDEDPNDVAYGFPLIYMPQAAMFSGGLNNDYPVPGPNPQSPNYSIDSVNNTVNIVLGVYRAGLQALEAYSVDVYTNTDTLSSLFENEVYDNAAILPEDTYTIPGSISVADGERENTFYLVLDKTKLAGDYQELSGKILFTAIGIRNPSKYELNKALSTTIVLIDSTITF